MGTHTIFKGQKIQRDFLKKDISVLEVLDGEKGV